MEHISIIIVTFNAATTLQRCLDSIYRQRNIVAEIIIIDGNSTDATVDIIKANTEYLYYWESNKDNGIYDAMNKALKHIKSKWVYFIGADDELYDDFSNFVLELADNTCIYYANVITRGIKRSGELTAYQQAKDGIFHQAMIYPKSVFEKFNYNLRYRIFADYELNMRCFKHYNFLYKDYIIAHFNHTGSSGFIEDIQFKKDKSSLIYRNFGLIIWLRYIFKQMKEKFRKKN
jgi:glycosyltransferase involved in cell wall biosynthesis